MQIDNMLSESLQLLVLGMGTVFFILVLLIACLSVMASLLSAPVEVTDSDKHAEPQAEKPPAASISVVASIQSAIHFYRTSHNR